MAEKDLVEAIARAIAIEDEDGWLRLCDDIPDTADTYRDDARAALQAIEEQGFVVVPKEPTEEMIDAACPDLRERAVVAAHVGYDATVHDPCGPNVEAHEETMRYAIREGYRAMIVAAHKDT